MNCRSKPRTGMILYKAPGADWEYRTLPVISTDALQEQVGGWIEFGIGAAMQSLVDRNPLGEFDLLCDEDGRAKRLPLNITVPAPFAYGTGRDGMLNILGPIVATRRVLRRGEWHHGHHVSVQDGDLQRFLALEAMNR